MNRRTFLHQTAGSSVLVLAGCTGQTDENTQSSEVGATEQPETEPTNSVSPVSVTAESVTPTNPEYEMDITWNSQAQTSVTPPDRDITTYAESGNKWLVFRILVANVGTSARELNAVQYIVQTKSGEHEIVAFRSGYLGGATIDPGEQVSRWMAFHIPADATTATLTMQQDRVEAALAVSFSHDSSLEINVPR
jgi:hypothetical protein